MRTRNLKNKAEILNNATKFITNPEDYKGKWQKLFQNNNPIYIEIGMGKGQFIKEQAKANPNINFIGIEKFDNILAKAIKKIDSENLDNLYIIRADAKNIDNIFDKEISRIYLNFSDPWPKNRHHKRRLTHSNFLDKYHLCFKQDEEIFLRTDNEDLFCFSIESLSSNGYSLQDVTLDLHKDEENFITTEYEDKFVEKGMRIYELKAYRKV